MAETQPKQGSNQSSAHGLKPWSILGLIRLERYTDILSFFAFVIAISTAFYQTYSYVRGASLVVYPSPWVLIVADRFSINRVRPRIGLELTAANLGDIGHNAAIKTAFVEFYLGTKKIRQEWQAVKYFDSSRAPPICKEIGKRKSDGNMLGDSRKNQSGDDVFCYARRDKLIVKQRSTPLPRVVVAGSAISEEVFFESVRVECAVETKSECDITKDKIEWSVFLKLIKGLSSLNFKIGVEDFAGNISCISSDLI